ncbi:MAG: hypothetical protein FWD03_07795 [Defluviitaleaceae bacterium]|nr:hypothetical protein [Defluviitaleaceae bacterium]
MAYCKKYTNMESAATSFRTRPVQECSSCAYFDPKNCGAHHMYGEFTAQLKSF